MAGLDSDYQALKGFLGHFFDKYLPAGAGLAPEHHPLAVLARMEATAPGKARSGLVMAINDCLEMSAHFTSDEVKVLDADLDRVGLPTLSALRLRFWKRIQTVLKRGKIRTEVEYYAIRNAVDVQQTDVDRARLLALLEDFEARKAA